MWRDAGGKMNDEENASFFESYPRFDRAEFDVATVRSGEGTPEVVAQR